MAALSPYIFMDHQEVLLFRYLRAAVFCLLALSASFSVAQESLNNDAIIKLEKAGLGDNLVISTIKTQPGTYSLQPQDLVNLKQAGVSDQVISAMMAKSSAVANSAPAGPTPVDASSKIIPKDATVYVAPMEGYETYIISALEKKKVPLTVVNDRTKAEFEIGGVSESQKAGWSKMLLTGSIQSAEQASVNVSNIKTGIVVFAYSVNKRNSVHGKQSSAEACAKHLKEKIESGK